MWCSQKLKMSFSETHLRPPQRKPKQLYTGKTAEKIHKPRVNQFLHINHFLETIKQQQKTFSNRKLSGQSRKDVLVKGIQPSKRKGLMSLVLSGHGGTGRLAGWPLGKGVVRFFGEKTQMMGLTINVEQSTWGKLDVLGDFLSFFWI